MENKRGKKSKTNKPNDLDGKKFVNGECESADKNIAKHKMDEDTIKVQKETKTSDGGKRCLKKQKIQTVVQSLQVAGPSRMASPQNSTIIEKSGPMIVCKYKLPPQVNPESTKPFEIKWGQNFLNTLIPTIKTTKSIMKSPCKETKAKPRTRFSQVTVYYFERTQSYSSKRSKGDKTVGMEQEHFYSNLLPVDMYEHQKKKRYIKKHTAMCCKDYIREAGQFSQQKSNNKKAVHSIQVPTELMDKDDNQSIVQKPEKGCSCNDYCDPDICKCYLNGKQCEVYKDNYPCGCKMEYCKNPNGRKAYNIGYVKQTIATFEDDDSPAPVRGIKNGRIHKRKQPAPTRYRKY